MPDTTSPSTQRPKLKDNDILESSLSIHEFARDHGIEVSDLVVCIGAACKVFEVKSAATTSMMKGFGIYTEPLR
jgi:hypothetical protein